MSVEPGRTSCLGVVVDGTRAEHRVCEVHDGSPLHQNLRLSRRLSDDALEHLLYRYGVVCHPLPPVPLRRTAPERAEPAPGRCSAQGSWSRGRRPNRSRQANRYHQPSCPTSPLRPSSSRLSCPRGPLGVSSPTTSTTTPSLGSSRQRPMRRARRTRSPTSSSSSATPRPELASARCRRDSGKAAPGRWRRTDSLRPCCVTWTRVPWAGSRRRPCSWWSAVTPVWLSRSPSRRRSFRRSKTSCSPRHALGLGSTLTTLTALAGDELAALLALPPEVVPVAVVPLGRLPAPLGPPRRRPLSEKAYLDRYGTPFPAAKASKNPQ